MKNYLYIILLLVLFPALVNAETLYLQDGTIIKGKIKKADNEFLWFETLYGTNKIKKIFIKKIEYENLSPVYDKTSPSTKHKTIVPSTKKKNATTIQPKKYNHRPKPRQYPKVKPTPKPRKYYGYNKYKYSKPKKKYFTLLNFNWQFSNIEDITIHEEDADGNNKTTNTMTLYGISFKFFEWSSIWGFGMNFIGNKNHITFEDKNQNLSKGNFTWTTMAATFYFRIPNSYFSPYVGFGGNINIMEYERTSVTPSIASYSYNTIGIVSSQEKHDENRLGGHIDIGMELYLWKVLVLDLGMRYYSIKESQNMPFNKFNTFNTTYFNLGLMF
jgi:outer membrane protein W